MNQYPTYKKAVDPDGNTVALICKESETKIVVLQPVAASNRDGFEVNIAQVSNDDELKSIMGGQIFPCGSEEYNDTLFSTWGFDGSNVYRAGEKSETATEGETNDNGATNDGSASQVESEQQSGDASVNTDASGSSNNGLGSQSETVAGSDVSANANAESEGQSGSDNAGNDDTANQIASTEQVADAPVKSAGSNDNEPEPVAGTSDGDTGSDAAKDSDGSAGTPEDEKAA